MTRHLWIFLATFVGGALAALIVRAALFEPHAGHEGHPASGGDYAPMVTNAPSTAPAPVSVPTPPSAPPAATPADPHAGHGAAAPASDAKPVNTVCAICGMDVDPSVPTATYQGKVIGFGCRMCPPKFAADPDRYGPFYLRNAVVEP